MMRRKLTVVGTVGVERGKDVFEVGRRVTVSGDCIRSEHRDHCNDSGANMFEVGWRVNVSGDCIHSDHRDCWLGSDSDANGSCVHLVHPDVCVFHGARRFFDRMERPSSLHRKSQEYYHLEART
jgi:hypothetical protein